MVSVKFGMRSRPSMLVISDGCGHTSSSRADLLPFESNRGSKSNGLSATNKSAGSLISTYSPGSVSRWRSQHVGTSDCMSVESIIGRTIRVYSTVC